MDRRSTTARGTARVAPGARRPRACPGPPVRRTARRARGVPLPGSTRDARTHVLATGRAAAADSWCDTEVMLQQCARAIRNVRRARRRIDDTDALRFGLRARQVRGTHRLEEFVALALDAIGRGVAHLHA